jgi:anaerobic selenocysteine-containing dehydrogenase
LVHEFRDAEILPTAGMKCSMTTYGNSKRIKHQLIWVNKHMTQHVKHTTCPMDCPDTCSLAVTVNDGKIEKITAGTNHPNTNGFICTKIHRFGRRVYSPLRLTSPMQNTGDKFNPSFKPISWEAAIDTITDRFRTITQQFGAEAILPYNYGGSNGFATDEYTDRLFFDRLGASRISKTLCAVPTTQVSAAMYGKMPGVAFEDFVSAKIIIIWGANPGKSNIHLIPYIKKARNNGAFVAAIDPINNFSQNLIDMHLPVKPGTDLILALAMINYWFSHHLLNKDFINLHTQGIENLLKAAQKWPVEKAAYECGVPAKHIIAIAQRYAAAQPALIRCGWGLERNVNGGQAVAAILAIPALMGKFGIRGGGYTLSNSGFLKFKPEFADQAKTRILNMTQLGNILNDAQLDPPIKALFIYNANPVATVPDQNAIIRGLQQKDLFTVVFDQVMTDSAQYADIILPATTFMEHYDVRRSYGSYYYGKITPVISAVGKAKSNHEVFSLLARKMGYQDEIFYQPQQDLPEILQRQFKFLNTSKNPVQFKSVFPATIDGKVDLCPAVLGKKPYSYNPIMRKKFPLAMISPATEKTINSSLGEYNLSEFYTVMNPADAKKRQISQHDIIIIYNDLGKIKSRVYISERVRTGVVVLPKGAWRKSSLNGATATALCPTHVNVVGGGACYNDARVEVKKAD